MARLDDLGQAVRELYQHRDADLPDWVDWLYPNHVLVVAAKAKELAAQKGANPELAEAAALLHDIADVKMERTDEHEQVSLTMARQLLQEHGFTGEEIALVVDDAIRLHSCQGGERPTSAEGLVLSTADALAHFQTDFYVFAVWAFFRDDSLEELKAWVMEKIDRDRDAKIAWDDVRATVQGDYDRIKTLFSR